MWKTAPAILIFIFAFLSNSAAQESSGVDTTLTRNYGPYEARGTIEPEKRHIPFYQHLWKIVEYPTELGVRIATLPLMSAGHLLEQDSEVGDFTSLFYFDNNNAYVFPSFSAQSDRGFDCGLEFNHTDLLPAHAVLNMKVQYGGRSEHEYRLRIASPSSRNRASGFSLSIRDTRRSDRLLYPGGITSMEADRADYIQKDQLVSSRWSFSPTGDVTTGLSAAYRYTDATHIESPTVDWCCAEERWEVATEIVYDDRAFGDLSPRGWEIGGSLGRVFGSRSVDPDYWKYAASIQKHFNIFKKKRILHLSAATRGILRIDGEPVPFWDLPVLGGRYHLRGYSVDRFRDYVKLIFSAQYRYPIFQRLNGSVFIDFGSVAREWSDFEMSQFKTGYGWAFETRLDDNLMFGFQVAHSREGFQLYVGAHTLTDLLEEAVIR